MQSLYTALDTNTHSKRLRAWRHTVVPETDKSTHLRSYIPQILAIIRPNQAASPTTAITSPTINSIPAVPKSSSSRHNPSMPSFTGLHKSLFAISLYHLPCKPAGQSEQRSNSPVIVKSSCPSVTHETGIEARATVKVTSTVSRRKRGSRASHSFFTSVTSCIIKYKRQLSRYKYVSQQYP